MNRFRSIGNKMRHGVWGLMLPMLFAPSAALGCHCQTSFAPCNEAAISNLVFIGTVESISPVFLSRWNRTSHISLQSLNDAYLDAQDHPSTGALGRLRTAYMKAFPDLGPEERERLQAAKTAFDVSSVFYSTLNGGMKVRFKVGTLFKHEEADDDDVPAKPQVTKSEAKAKANDGDDDDDKKNIVPTPARKDDDDDDYFEISTPFGDCGIEFQVGETYLVYADDDEETGNLSATVCTRTRRLTDAGEDLAYLFFYKEHREQSTRLEGFTTTDVGYQLELNKMNDPTSMKSPVPGLVLELSSQGLTRFTTSDNKGRFVFDGLAGGEYSLTAFDGDYPKKQNLRAGPQKFSLEPESCALQVLVVHDQGSR